MSNVIKGVYAVKLIFLAAIFSNAFLTLGQTPVPQATGIPAVVLQGHRSGVTAVRFSTDGAWLASSSLDGAVRIWSTRTWIATRILNHGAEIYAIAFSQDAHLLVSGGYDRRLMFWETRSGQLRRAVKLPDWVVAITFTPSGQIAVGCSDGVVRLLDLNTGVIKRTINTENELMSLAVSADGRYLATGPPIKLWDLASGQLLSKGIRGQGQGGLAFTPSGERLASAEGTGGSRIWSVPSGEAREELRIEAQKQVLGPSGYVPAAVNMPAAAIAFSRDGTGLATGGSDFGVQLWQVARDTVAKAPMRVLSGHTMTVTGVSFSSDGRYLASASLDRTVRIWKLR